MKNKLIAIAALLIIVISFLCWWYSDKQVILRKTKDAIETLHFEKDSGRIERAFKSDKLNNLLANQLTISYPEGNFHFTQADELSEPITLEKSQAVAAHRYITEIASILEISDISSKVIDINDTTAQVDIQFTMRAQIKHKKAQEHTLSAVITFAKENDIWLISEAKFQDHQTK